MNHMRMLVAAILLGGIAVVTGSAQGNGGTVWSGTVGQRQVVVDERWTPPFTDGLVTVRATASGRTSTIQVSTAGRSPHLVAPSGPDRLVVIASELASVVDLAAQLVVDQFLVSRPALSPDGRYLAYQRFQPRGSQDEDVLLLYDVSATAPLNRVPSNARGLEEAMRDAGLPVFPEWHSANRTYTGRSGVPGAPIETLRSGVVWSSNTGFVFLAGRGGPADRNASLAIYHVEVRGGGQRPIVRSQTIDASKLTDANIKILDCAGSTCEVQIEWAPAPSLGEPSQRVTF